MKYVTDRWRYKWGGQTERRTDGSSILPRLVIIFEASYEMKPHKYIGSYERDSPKQIIGAPTGKERKEKYRACKSIWDLFLPLGARPLWAAAP